MYQYNCIHNHTIVFFFFSEIALKSIKKYAIDVIKCNINKNKNQLKIFGKKSGQMRFVFYTFDDLIEIIKII